jgi:prevent-host-death family protein
MQKTLTATEARKTFYDVIERAKHPGVSLVITHEGLPKVVVMSFEEFEGWQETMEILSDGDASLEKDLQAGIKEMKSGKKPKNTISLHQLKKKLQH